MNYIKFFIENHIKEKNYEDEAKNIKKAFIFSVHMNRIFNIDKQDPKKAKYLERNELGELISHLSDFYQIFIDDLNGENISLTKIMTYNEKDLFKECLKLDKEFMKNIYNAFSYFNYQFIMDIPFLKEDKYSIELIKYLENEKGLVKDIIDCVLRQKTKQKDIFNEILKNNYFKQEDVGLISVIQKYLTILFTDSLTQFVFKSEKDHFLSTFLFNELYKKNTKIIKIEPNKENKNMNVIIEDKEEEINQIQDNENRINEIIDQNKINEINNEENKKEDIINVEKEIINYNENHLIKKLIKYYLETLDTSLTARFNKKIKNNKITLLLGLKLPGIKYILNCFRIYIKSELAEKYFNNEKEIRYISPDEEDFLKEINGYKNRIKINQRNMETEINKNELFQILNECGKEYPEDSKQFYEWLLDDYYLIFLSDTLQNIKNSFIEIEDYIKILKKMIFFRFNLGNEVEEIDPVRNLAKKMVWLESNSQYISILLNMYSKISSKINEKNLFNKIEEIIEKKEVQYEISNRSPQHTEEVNLPFFNIMESLLKIITSDFDIYRNLKKQDFYDFVNSIKTIIQNALKIVNDLIIFSKEVFTIQEFLNIQENLNLVNKSNRENLLKILQILSDQLKFTNIILNDETKYQDLCQNIQNLNDFLYENLGDTDIFANLMLDICVDEIKKVRNDNYRKKLTDIVLGNPKMIAKSYPFMSIVLKGLIDTSIDSILDNINKIKENNRLYLETINKTNSDVLNEIILSIFENQFNSYFESIPNLTNDELIEYFEKYFNYYRIHNKYNPTFILFNTSLTLFNDCLNFLEGIYHKEQEKDKIENNKNELISILYCISYIKMYLYKCIHFIHFNNQDFIDFDQINKVIEGNAKNAFRKMIKIYVFKIFFHILNNNYHEFANYHYPNHGIKFFDEFKEKFNEKKEAMLSYYLLPLGENYEKYKEEYKIFDDYRFEDFNKPVKQFKDLVEKNGIDIIYTISTNLIVSNLALKNYIIDSQEYSKYSSFITSVFDKQLKIPEITKKLFLLFSKDEEYNTKMRPKLIYKDVAEINQKSFEILLYSLRFCLQIVNHEKPEEFLYSQIFTNQYSAKLKENCIPGNNLLDNIKVNNYYYVENHLKTKAHDIGAYVCSCGLYYDIPPCGFPAPPEPGEPQVTFCGNPECNLPVGYSPKPPSIPGQHGMVIRDGHYRIFKDAQHKEEELNDYGDNDQNIPNMLLADYKTIVIDPILESSKFGINQISKIRFVQNNMTVRKLSQVGYRLLNFILYSHLFFANCLGIISDEDMNKYVCGGMTYIEMLETDWNLLKDALLTKGIQIIQIFMNMIFYKISEKLKNCKAIKTNEEREQFENEIEKILEESYKEYEEYSKKYLEENKNALQLEKDNMKSFVLEINNIKEYEEKKYPFYKFLLMTTYPCKDNFINELQKVPEFEKKYPLLTSYLINDNKTKDLIKYLPDFNEFTNFMIDNYSYKISRDEASKKLIKDEEIYKNNERGFKDMFTKFKKIWAYLKPYATKFGCREEMPQIDLDENKSIAHFLNDDGEICKGMYIASAYQNFITWQNQFLDELIGPLRQNGILHHFIKNMGKNIDVQNAKKNETLNFDKINESFIETIFDNSKRNIFTQNNNINYSNYKQFIYDFDSIEESLGEILLPGKVKFNGTPSLRFVTYCFEGFRGNKTSVLSDFASKYKLKSLSKENKQIIYDKIKDKINNQNDELSKILFSIQLLIYYLTQDIKPDNEEIKKVIEELPDYVNLSKECSEFFEKQTLKVNELNEAYSYIELLCFKPIIANLRDHYKKQIDDYIIENINKSFEEKQFKIITKISLASACRKLISRYLISIRDDTDYNENNKLDLYLNREEMWSKEIWGTKEKNENIEQDLEILRKNELILGQCYDLYTKLGGDEQEAYKDIIVKNEDDKEENIQKENVVNEKIVKRKKKIIY